MNKRHAMQFVNG